jgi:hypothetical protein
LASTASTTDDTVGISVEAPDERFTFFTNSAPLE